MRTLRISPANHVTKHVTTNIVSDTGSISGVGSSLLWVKSGYFHKSSDIIATSPDTVVANSSNGFKHIQQSGGTTISSNGTLHNVTMDGSRDWLVRPSCLLFHSGLSLGSSPKPLRKLKLDLISGRGNFYINSYNAQITEVPAGQSVYVDRDSLLALEYDQNSGFQIGDQNSGFQIGGWVESSRGSEPSRRSRLDVSSVSVLDMTGVQTGVQSTPVAEPVQEKPVEKEISSKPSPQPHYYLYNNRWWITMSKLSRSIVNTIISIPSALIAPFTRKNTKKYSPKNFSRPQTPPKSLMTRIKSFISSYTNPTPFQSFVHIRGPTRVVVGQNYTPKFTTEANKLEPYVTDPILAEPVVFEPQTHDFLKVAEVVNGRVVFRSVPNFSNYKGVS